ncbi:MAG: hypothetical protein FJW31_13865 [Acidobacteria bacterium]|nr:hypothetical protein [Acidobacteriota bacterium]
MFFFLFLLCRVVVGLAAGAWLLAAPPAARAAVQVEIHFPVLERAISEQMFAQDGRRYVKGSKADKCSFAYLSKPKLGGWNGKLTIKARFTGRSALDVIGRCIGLGDDFDLTVLAEPHYQSGKLRLKNVSVVTEGKDSMYIRNVRQRLGQSLEREFTYPLDADAKRILEEPKPGSPFKQELRDFGISVIEVTSQAVVLPVDFRLSVK